LFAPEKGEKTRKDISKKSKKLLQKINDQMSKEKLTELKKEFEGQLNNINEKIKSFANID
jgi:gas vesicle protein